MTTATTTGRALLVVLLTFIVPLATASETRSVLYSASGLVVRTASGDSLVFHRASLRMSMLYQSKTFSQALPAINQSIQGRFADDRTRSVPLAFGLSAVIPGAGQAYNKQWIKAAVAVTIEAVLIATYLSKKDQGQETENAYIAFALEDWNPGQYGDWLNDYTVFLNSELGAGIDVPEIDTEIGVDFQHPETWSSENWEAVNTMFSQMHHTERSVFHVETGASFSHQLPDFSSQQYYELIGKYYQFAPGWSDYPEWIDGNGDFTEAIDPEMTGPGGSKPNVSQKFFKYAEDHAESQDLFRSASHYGLLIALNHIVAAIDAAIVSKLHNDRILTRLSLSYSRTGDVAPSVGIGIRL